ncbi:MAG: diaminopimelate epimerase [Proteobacteria bacterium]|nr:diaminopimelate epimerase [Pseudomonadota bacterium]MDA0992983.1 diaminopimelate epimerase [Pseudomonadota bacterium]
MTQAPYFGTTPSGRFFVKMHGLQNHFVITDARSEEYRPSDDEIIRICDQKTGIGGDQLLIIQPPTEVGRAGAASAFMRILNVDAREVEACGNATRCVAWLLMEEEGSDEITLETLAGVIACKKTGEREVSCAMGRVSMNWQDVPLSEDRDTLHLNLGQGPLRDGVALNIGNPHVVFFVGDTDTVDIESIAPGIQTDALFPDQVNVGVATIESSSHMSLKVYERGAGLTMACGSGACAAVYAAIARGLTDKNTMTVSMPAGDMHIEIRADGNAIMTGPVEFCFSGFY